MAQRRPELWIEGRDGLHTISHLLQRHGLVVKEDRTEGLHHIDHVNGPWLRDGGNVDQMLESIEPTIKLGDQHPVGFVIDADDSLESRWKAICDSLRRVDAEPPGSPDPGGTIIDVPKFKTRAGIWLMPDNQRSGAIEEFLRDLIATHDPLIDHAVSATSDARQLGAKFRDVDEGKAQLHTWLAWQEKPGRPYGVAVKAEYFLYDAPAAQAFVTWVRTLFDLPP